MNQSEKRLFLIRSLLNERPSCQKQIIPADSERQKILLRGLMNVRRPQPVGADFLQVQDEYLQVETAAKGITDISDLSPIQPGLYLWQGDITTLRCDAIVNAANSGLTGCYVPNHRCIDNAIHTYAGVELRLACAELMEQQGYPEPTGQAKITPAFDLPCTPWDPSSAGGLRRRTRTCWPPATAPVWNWRQKMAWKAWRSAAFPPANFISPTSWRQRLQ